MDQLRLGLERMSSTAAAKRFLAPVRAKPLPVSATTQSVSTTRSPRESRGAQAKEAAGWSESVAFSSASQPLVSRNTASAGIAVLGMSVEVMVHVGGKIRNASLRRQFDPSSRAIIAGASRRLSGVFQLHSDRRSVRELDARVEGDRAIPDSAVAHHGSFSASMGSITLPPGDGATVAGKRTAVLPPGPGSCERRPGLIQESTGLLLPRESVTRTGAGGMAQRRRRFRHS